MCIEHCGIKKHSYEFVKSEIEKRDGVLLSEEYENSKQKLEVKCNKCNNIWNPTYSNIKFGYWCPICAIIKITDKQRHTYEFVKLEIEKRNGILLSENYINEQTKLKVKCNKCNYIWEVMFYSIQNGTWCPECAKVIRSEKQKFTYEFVKLEIEKRNGILISKFYKNNRQKLEVKCNKCEHIWESTFNRIQKGSWCPECAKIDRSEKLRYDYEFVKSEIEKRDGVLLSENYINSFSKIEIKCNKCEHIWKVKFNDIRQGCWCPKCSGKMKFTYEFVKTEIEKRDGILLSTEYKNNKEKIEIKCNKCEHIWKTKFNSIRQGCWCPKCSLYRTQKLLQLLFEKILNTKSILNYRGFEWLKDKSKMEIDIFIPEIKLAIEYDGKQHFKPIEYFGGKEEFKLIKRRDKLKNKLIKEHPEDVKYFIRFNYKQEITEEFVKIQLQEKGLIERQI